MLDPGLLTPNEARAIIAALPHDDFDVDADTVDDEPSYEFYLSKQLGWDMSDATLATMPGKPEAAGPAARM